MKKIILIFSLISLLFGCTPMYNNEKVNCYVTHTKDSIGNDLYKYYYTFSMNDGDKYTYYLYSSPLPVTSFINISWNTSTTNPIEIMGNENIVEQLPDLLIPTEELPYDIQVEMFDHPEYFEGLTNCEISSYEIDNSCNDDKSSNIETDSIID